MRASTGVRQKRRGPRYTVYSLSRQLCPAFGRNSPILRIDAWSARRAHSFRARPRSGSAPAHVSGGRRRPRALGVLRRGVSLSARWCVRPEGLISAHKGTADKRTIVRLSANPGRDQRVVDRQAASDLIALEGWVLRLQPLPAVAARISAAGALRDDPLQAQLASLGEHERSLGHQGVTEQDAMDAGRRAAKARRVAPRSAADGNPRG